MAAELARLGHPMLAALLTIGLSAPVQAGVPAQDSGDSIQEAQLSEELELMKEEETVSIASRYEQPISQAPSNVYVITDEDIRQSGATDIPTILRRIPGIEVMQTTGADLNVSARGDNQLFANKMLVMVDGRSIYVDAQGIVFWKMLPVTLPEIKRIEVLKGPASSVYGFNAFDGVINIITKSPEEIKGTTLQFGGGGLGTISSAAIQAGTVGNMGYRLSIGHDQNQEWRNHDALALRANRFNGLTEYKISQEGVLKLSGGIVDSNRSDGPIVDTTLSSAKPSLGYTYLGYERPDFFIRGFWTQYSDTFDINPVTALDNLFTITDSHGFRPSNFQTNTYNAEMQHTMAVGATNHMIYGVNYRNNTIKANYLSQFGNENRLGLYVQDEWQITETLTITGGLRYDLDTFINPTVSPRGAVVYRPHPDHSFRGSITVAYRPPTVIETFFNSVTTTNPPLPPSNTFVRGSPNLSPEEIISYEAGYQGWYLKHRLRIRTDLFFNHISDLIGGFNANVNTVVNNNSGASADIYGGEAGADFLITRWLSGFANYSYQEIGQSFTGTIQRAAPRFKWNVGLRGEWANGISADAAFHHYGSVTYPLSSAFAAFAAIPGTGVIVPDPRVGSYNLLNMRAAYKFWHQKAVAGYLREAEVAVSAFNALNDRHKEHPLGDTIGSRWMGWLTVRF